MNFASDNAGPAHPSVIDALGRANEGYASGYGAEAAMERVRDRVRAVFEAPEAAVYLVATGTAANSLLLATLSRPWQTVFCAPMAHIQEDECNAPEFYSGGAKLTLVPEHKAKITPEGLRARILAEEGRGVHGPQRGPVSITQATEKGTVYSRSETQEIGAICAEFGLPLHMDGARFTNALVHLGCTPAEATWKAGVTALSFGGTKNGLLGVECAVLFDPGQAQEFEYRRKRGAHLFSKHRYLSAQVEAYLDGDLWLDLAGRANHSAARLADGLSARGIELLWPVEANLMFFRAPRGLHRRLMDGGARYYLWDGEAEGDPADLLTARLVCDWSMTDAGVDAFLALI